MKTMLYSVLISLIFDIISSQKDARLISARYYSGSTSYETGLQIGTPFYANYYLIDIVSSYTWMVKFLYSLSEKSSTKKIINESIVFNVDKYSIRGMEIEDTVTFGTTLGNMIQSYPFFVVKDYGSFVPYRMSGIAFAFKFNDTKYSIVHQLKKNNLIDHLSFSLIRENKGKGMVYIGGMPIQASVNKIHSSCKVKGMSHLWDCHLNKVIIGIHTYINDKYTYFDTINDVILAPQIFLEFLVDNYFKKGLQLDQCQLIYGLKTRKEIKCSKNYIETLPNITWIIDTYAYHFNSALLFKCKTNDDCYFLLALNNNKDEFVFGKKFLNHFDLLFDYENEQIQFYSQAINVDYYSSNRYNDDNIGRNNKNKKYFIIMMITISVTMIAGIGIIGIRYCIEKKSYDLINTDTIS